MKIFHISDLHIGKQLVYYSLKSSQEYALKMIVRMALEKRPDVIVISGDIYDKSVPSGEAYTLFDDFLVKLSDIRPCIPVLIISGNHDSNERLSYAKAFLEKHNIYISALPPKNSEDRIKVVTLNDEFGEVNFYLVPFIKPSYIKNQFDEGIVTDYNSAFKSLIERENIDYGKRNVIVAHQFFVSGSDGPEKCDSEISLLSVGGIDSIDISCIKNFDYAALGHIHGQQKIGENYIRYSGSPLKYSVSEEKHNKSVTMVTMGKKGDTCNIELLSIPLLQDVRKIRGTLREVISMSNDKTRKDYVSIELTDEDELYMPREILGEYYDYILDIKLDNSRTRKQLEEIDEETTTMDPYQAFCEFFNEMNGREMNNKENEELMSVISKITGEQ